jgi:hypothetical protein
MPPKPPARRRADIEPRTYAASLPVYDIRALLRSADSCVLDSRNQQLVLPCDFAKNECSRALPAAIVAKVLGIRDSPVWRIQSKWARRPLTPSSEQDDPVVASIESGYPIGSLTSPRYVLNIVEAEFGKCVTYGWMHSVLTGNEAGVYRTIVSPQGPTQILIPEHSWINILP